ncbi:MAG TPA: GvpL/GvpF family gas vesicle protein [Longimicrobiaceae bacterium]|nr:GvpL/GvpF family gas vesicle protein [Longimicrobiaceae bacterium]
MPDRHAIPRVWEPGELDSPGLRLLGVIHSERRRAPIWEAPSGGPVDAGLVRHRDLAALVYPGALRVDALDLDDVRAHHRRLESMLQRETVVPAPYGVAFRGEKEVVRFLREQYTELGDALVFVEGRWEFRLHLTPEEPDFPEALALDLATHVYAELRKLAHAAVPFPRGEPRAFSSAFLVDRVGTRGFLERVEELGAEHSDLALDATGPWPPYDFVRIRLEAP